MKTLLSRIGRPLLAAGLVAGCAGCQSLYYGAMEKVGVHKRDIMVDRVKAARDSQNAAKEQFVTALDAFRNVVRFQGGSLEQEYKRLDAVLKKSEAAAAAVRQRIDAVEAVSTALFKEWRAELRQYSSPALRRASQDKYDATREKYVSLIAAMRKSEASLEPVLIPLRDQVLFLKHNLNARAVAGLDSELAAVQSTVEQLIRDMEASIAEADTFIAALQAD